MAGDLPLSRFAGYFLSTDRDSSMSPPVQCGHHSTGFSTRVHRPARPCRMTASLVYADVLTLRSRSAQQ